MKSSTITRLASGIAVVGISTLVLSAPVAGEFNADALINQVNHHETRITDLEHKTDSTQTQVNQASADVQALQQSTKTAPAPTVEPVATPVAQPAPSTAAPVQPAAEPAPAPAPTVVSVNRSASPTNGGGFATTCTYKFSDGSTDTKVHSGDMECPAQP